MKTKQLLIIFPLLLMVQAFAQYHTPQSPLSIPKNNLKKDLIVQKLSSQRVLYTQMDIDELKLEIRKSNNNVDNKISMIKSKMSNLFMDKQELLQLKDIEKIKEVITEKKNNRKEIEEQVQNDLSGINYKGLFIIVLKNIDPWASKQQLADKSEKALTPKAIEDLNGVFISSMTTVEQSQFISDRIKSIISGEMSIEKQFISRTIDNRTKFLYLVKVNVAPLKKSFKATSGEIAAAETNLTINAMTEKDYQTKLQNFDVSQDEINKIRFEVEPSQESIQLANTTAGRRQMDIIRNGNANLAKVDEEIRNLENSLTNRSSILKQLIESKTTVTYDQHNSDKSVNEALKYLDSELAKLKSQLISTKEQELIPRYSVSVTAEGTPAEDIAKTAIDIAGQIEQSYSKIEQFMEETTVKNFMLTDYKQGQQKDVYRELESVWLYPVAGDQDNFLLTIVAKFKITSDRTSNSEKVPTQIKEKPISPPDPFKDMVFIEGGEFIMGNDGYAGNNQPAHQVWVDGFYIDKYEVTNAQFCQFLNEKGNQTDAGKLWLDIRESRCQIVYQNGKYLPKAGYDHHPVINVTWYGARAYAQWTGKRLPTEAEWEFAARGGNRSNHFEFSGSNNYQEVAWVQENTSDSQPIGLKKPNELGLYDMSGNVWEWCEDYYDAAYFKNSPYKNPRGPDAGSKRVIRGGAQSHRAGFSHVWSRMDYNPTSSYVILGFRCAKTPTGAGTRTSTTSDRNDNTVTDIDGNIYHTVKIGDQIWMAENLRVTHYRNGEPILQVDNPEEWRSLRSGAYCCYNYYTENAKNFGCLYNWYTVKDNRNIAPTGWHVPSRDEWLGLIDLLGGFSVAGGHLKETGTEHWNVPNIGATNSSGFSARASGYRLVTGRFTGMSNSANYWSSSEVNNDSAWHFVLSSDYSEFPYSDMLKQMGFSVRCVKD